VNSVRILNLWRVRRARQRLVDVNVVVVIVSLLVSRSLPARPGAGAQMVLGVRLHRRLNRVVAAVAAVLELTVFFIHSLLYHNRSTKLYVIRVLPAQQISPCAPFQGAGT